MRVQKILTSKNTLRMPMQCKDIETGTRYKGVSKTNWAVNAKRAAKRGVVRVYRPDESGEMRLVARV
jgi:hypothetical protein